MAKIKVLKNNIHFFWKSVASAINLRVVTKLLVDLQESWS